MVSVIIVVVVVVVVFLVFCCVFKLPHMCLSVDVGENFLSRFRPSCIKCGLFAVRKKRLLQFSQLLFTPLCLNLPTLHISPNFPSQRPTLGRWGWLKVKDSWLFSSTQATPLLSHSTHGALLSLCNASDFTWLGCAAVSEGIFVQGVLSLSKKAFTGVPGR